MPAADGQTLGTEVADVDAVTVRVEIRTADVELLEEPFAGCQIVADDRVDHHLRFRRFLVFRQERLLLGPVLARRVLDRGLPDQLPADRALVHGERFLVIPVLRIEQGLVGMLLGDAANVEDRQAGNSDEDVRVFARDQHIFAPRDVPEIGEVALRQCYSEVLHRFLDAEHVAAHDLARSRLRSRGFVAVVQAQGCDACRDFFAVVGVDLVHDLIGAIAECGHEALERSVGPT